MARLHPGVYIEEVPSGVRPIEGVSTSTTAFIGKAEMGALNKAVLITSPQEFETKYGTFLSDSSLAHAVFQFFNNGGKKCYILRIAGSGARAAEIAIKDRKHPPAKTLTIKAANEGAWGNRLDITITNGTLDPDNEFSIQVFRDRSHLVPPLSPLPLETHDNLSMNADADNYIEKVIAENSSYITAEVDSTNISGAKFGNAADLLLLGAGPGRGSEDPGDAGPPATEGRSKSGVSPATYLPADKRKIVINLDGDGEREIIIAPSAATGGDIADAIQDAVSSLTANQSSNQTAYNDFTCTYDETDPAQPFYLLKSGTTGVNSSVVVTDAATVIGISRSGPLHIGNAADLLLLGAGPGRGSEDPGDAGPPATEGRSKSGVSPATYLPADKRKIVINLDGDGEREIIIPFSAATGDEIASAIQKAVSSLTANQSSNQTAYNDFTCTYDETDPAQPFYLLKSGTTGVNSSVVVTDHTDEPIKLEGPDQHKFVITVDGDGPHVVTLPPVLADGAAIAAAIQDVVRAITPKRSVNASAFQGFECTYENTAIAGNPSLLLTCGAPGVGSSVRVTDDPSQLNVARLLKLGLTNGGKEITGSAILRPANSKLQPEFPGDTEYHLGDAVVSGNIDSVTLGNDGALPGTQEYLASVAVGKSPLDIIRDVNIICIPGIGDADVVAAGTNYCTQRKDCFFIGDVNKNDDTVKEAQDFVNGLTVKSSYGAIYYPWLKMTNPTGKSTEPIYVPPSGFVAGMYSRIDAKRGVWKAPAGTEANISGAVGLVTETTDVQQDFLNPIGVNVIRSFPASGLVIWGARTLATRSDPEYRYIPVRRTAIFLEQSIYLGIQWAVFEPNDEDLWASLRLNIGAFMMLQFRAGAFQGKTPNDAFFVKCDSSTTTQMDIDAGIVNILVGFAPLKPAEFVVLKLSQKAGQPGV